MQHAPDQKSQTRRFPFWFVVVCIALLGIIFQSITGNSSIGQLFFLVFLLLITFKAFWFLLKASSLLLKIFLVIFILVAWLGTFLAQSPMLSQ